MTQAFSNNDGGWRAVLERFEQHAPASVMARTVLDQAFPPDWIDDVFETHRQYQYARELLFSTVVELMTLVVLGLRPSLHAAARRSENLPVSLTALYDKVNRTEPAVLRALVQASAARLTPAMAGLGQTAILPGWQVRVLDGNHFPGTEKRIAPLRGHRGAALPGQAVVVYDPDSALVLDMVAGEDAHQTERVLAGTLLNRAEAGQVWVADRHFCTRTLLEGWAGAGACFVVREHANHPRVAERGPWRDGGRVETGTVREQAITLEGHATPWRCVELTLDVPTEAGDTVLRIWSNLPATVSAGQIARTYKHRWSIEGLFGRLESVLHSEIRSLGQPRAACLAFAAALLAYNVLALVARCVERAHAPAPPVSLFHLAVHVRGGFDGLLIALPPEHWPAPGENGITGLIERLLQLARHIDPKRVAASKRGPKTKVPKGYVDGKTARTHLATARIIAKAKLAP